MRATAIAQPNIALIKYWGKRDTTQNLPAVGSISITLDSLFTRMTVSADAAGDQDVLVVNGRENPAMLPRISRCLDSLAGTDRPAVAIDSDCNFPIAAGLASSASAFAALVVAADAMFEKGLDRLELAQLAGRASGSAARSLFGGFVELDKGDTDIELHQLGAPEAWPLAVIVAITTPGPKPVSSGDAMELSRQTSPFYERWLQQQPGDLDTARTAIAAQDFAALASVAEHNCLKMHSVMWASRPPMIYWNSATLACMQTVRALQHDGVDVFFTIDAGPQLKAVCPPDHAADVQAALEQTPGVTGIMHSGLGPGARCQAA